MTDSLADILGKQRYDAPDEIGIIKLFVEKRFQHTPNVAIQQSQIIIVVPNSALAGSLRMYLHELKELCKTDKRLVIRIGR